MKLSVFSLLFIISIAACTEPLLPAIEQPAQMDFFGTAEEIYSLLPSEMTKHFTVENAAAIASALAKQGNEAILEKQLSLPAQQKTEKSIFGILQRKFSFLAANLLAPMANAIVKVGSFSICEIKMSLLGKAFKIEGIEEQSIVALYDVADLMLQSEELKKAMENSEFVVFFGYMQAGSLAQLLSLKMASSTAYSVSFGQYPIFIDHILLSIDTARHLTFTSYEKFWNPKLDVEGKINVGMEFSIMPYFASNSNISRGFVTQFASNAIELYQSARNYNDQFNTMKNAIAFASRLYKEHQDAYQTLTCLRTFCAAKTAYDDADDSTFHYYMAIIASKLLEEKLFSQYNMKFTCSFEEKKKFALLKDSIFISSCSVLIENSNLSFNYSIRLDGKPFDGKKERSFSRHVQLYSECLRETSDLTGRFLLNPFHPDSFVFQLQENGKFSWYAALSDDSALCNLLSLLNKKSVSSIEEARMKERIFELTFGTATKDLMYPAKCMGLFRPSSSLPFDKLDYGKNVVDFFNSIRYSSLDGIMLQGIQGSSFLSEDVHSAEIFQDVPVHSILESLDKEVLFHDCSSDAPFTTVPGMCHKECLVNPTLYGCKKVAPLAANIFLSVRGSNYLYSLDEEYKNISSSKSTHPLMTVLPGSRFTAFSISTGPYSPVSGRSSLLSTVYASAMKYQLYFIIFQSASAQ